MFKRSTWLHLRIPFSFFLMPVFLFALSVSRSPDLWRSIGVFLSLHLFLYPASNGYNSYFDKDEKSIGGLKNPPPVERHLYYTALAFDLVALVTALFISWFFFFGIFLYGLASKAYSHPSVRLKKHPYLGWLITGFFQGFVIFIACYQAINEAPLADLANAYVLIPATLSTALLWGSYPMTQIYQHEEDRKRGDITLSYKLGIKGTFYFTAAVFSVATAGFVLFYYRYFTFFHAVAFLIFLLPVLIYFSIWFFRVNKDVHEANFKNTMNLNLISSLCLNSFFILFALF